MGIRIHYSRDVFLEEVDADGLLVVLGEDALAVALDHARLAHRTVPHDHNLKHKIKHYLSHGESLLRTCMKDMLCEIVLHIKSTDTKSHSSM